MVRPDLRATRAEYRPAHDPQPRRLQLQADDEQQQHHAEFGEVQDGLDVVDQAEHRWPDHDARREIAKHRAELQPAEQRHDDDRGRKEQERSGR